MRSRISDIVRCANQRLARSSTVALLLAAMAPGFAQQQNPPPPPNQQGQQQQGPQQGPPNQNGQGQNGQNGQNNNQPKKPNPIDEIRKAISRPETQNTTNTLTLRIVGLKDVNLNKPVLFKAIAADSSIHPSNNITYSSPGLPPGANLDVNSGDFSWTPTQPGTYTFYIVATDDQAPPRTAQKYITLVVPPPLPVFGQSFFVKARALVDARIAIARSGFLSGMLNPTPGTQQVPGQGFPGQPPYPFGSQPNLTGFPNGAPTAPGTFSGVPSAGFTGLPTTSGVSNGPPNQGFVPNQTNGQQGYPMPVNPYGQYLQSNPQGAATQYNPNQQPPQGGGAQQYQTNGSQPPNGTGQPMPPQGPNLGIAPTSGGPTGYYYQAPNAPLSNGQFPQYFQSPYGPQSFQQNGMAAQGINPQTGLPYQQQPFPFQGNPLLGPTYPNYQFPGAQFPGTGTGITQGQALNSLSQFVGPFEQIFNNVYSPAPERYQLGAGDTLHFKIWSETRPMQEFDVQVDDRGGINVPISGQRVVLRGQTLAQAEKQLRTELKDYVRNANLTLTLTNLRTMTVTVLGQAYLPGTYQVPAVMTLFNLIYMVGGPSDIGSYRAIEVHHNNDKVDRIDLYDFLEKGSIKGDIPLQPGDSVFFPAAKITVSVGGEVEQPGVYEAKSGESLASVLKYGGGAKPSGYTQNVSIATVQSGTGRVLRTVSLQDAKNDTHQLLDGDQVTVLSVRDTVVNQLDLEGAVQEPGMYEYKKGLRVSDLIKDGNGTIPQTYMQQADLFRKNPDQSTTWIRIDLAKAVAKDPAADVELAGEDRLVVYDIRDVQWNGDHSVEIRGAVKTPGPVYRADNMPASDLIMQAGGVLPDAYLRTAYIQRTNKDGTPGPLVKLNLQGLLSGDKSGDVILQDKDILIVQNVKDAMYIPDGNVQLLGAVVNPGTYVRGTNMHISDLLALGGGALPDTGDSVEVSHLRVNKDQPPTKVSLADVQRKDSNADLPLQDGDVVALTHDFNVKMNQYTVYITGYVKKPGPYSVIGGKERLSSLIKRAGGFAPNAFVEGGQFFRDPTKTTTAAQTQVSAHVSEALQIVGADDYRRALARSRVEMVRIVGQNSTNNSQANSVASSLGAGIPGLVTATQQTPNGVTMPDSITKGIDLVTPVRILGDDELIPGGNVNVSFAKAMAKPGTIDDIILTDGDIISIPEQPTTVSVIGAVVQPSLVAFREGNPISYYVRSSGGFANDAAKDHVLVIRANGLIIQPKGHQQVRPGDVIWVPTQVMAARLTDKNQEIDEISKNVTSAAVVVAVLAALLKL